MRQERAVVVVATASRYSDVIHPLHAVFLAGTVPLFLIATLSDAAYASTYEIQWINFAAWLNVGGLVFAALALLFAIGDLSRPAYRARGIGIYASLLFATWVVGFVSALLHARDAFGSMPASLVSAIIATVLACAATWFGFATPRTRGTT